MSRSPAHAHPSHWANSFGMHAPFFSILAKFSKSDFALWARIEIWGMHTREDRKMGHAYCPPRVNLRALVDRINMSGQEPVQPPFRLGRRRRLGSCPFPGYSSISNIYQAKNDGNEQSGCSCASIPLGKFIRYACPIFLS